jgi:hypothetical protein
LETTIQAHEGEQGSSSLEFPFPPSHLQPPLSLVQKNVQYCFDNFHKRQEQELKGELDLQIKRGGTFKDLMVRDVVARVGAMLSRPIG